MLALQPQENSLCERHVQVQMQPAPVTKPAQMRNLLQQLLVPRQRLPVIPWQQRQAKGPLHRKKQGWRLQPCCHQLQMKLPLRAGLARCLPGAFLQLHNKAAQQAAQAQAAPHQRPAWIQAQLLRLVRWTQAGRQCQTGPQALPCQQQMSCTRRQSLACIHSQRQLSPQCLFKSGMQPP